MRRRCQGAERFGLQFFPNPALSAFETTAFWLPDVMDHSLEAALDHESRRGRQAPSWPLSALPGRRHYLIGPGRRPKLIITAKGYQTQLAIASRAPALPQAAYCPYVWGHEI